MRSLLLVDDESNIRRGIRTMIERQYPNRYHIRAAASGEEALQIAEESPIDIVITDIRMPGMDGIALIAHLNRLLKVPLIMIVSGHDDFQYAKEAMKQDVKEYLLKPIVRQELSAALIRIEQECERREALASKLDLTDRYLEELRESQLAYMMMHTDLAPKEIAEMLVKLRLEAFAEAYYVAILRRNPQSSQRTEQQQFYAQLRLQIRKVSDEQSIPIVDFLDKDGHLVVVAGRSELLHMLFEQMDQHYHTFSMGLSEKMSELQQLPAAYLQASKALKYAFLQVTPALIAFSSIDQREMRYMIPFDQFDKLANMLGTDREQEMKALLQDIFDIERIRGNDIAYLEEIAKALNERVLDRVFHQYGEESVEILKIYRQVGSIFSMDHYYDYYRSVENLLLRLNEYVKNIKSVHIDHREIKHAITYIHENYEKDLSMAMVSNHVSLNYSYFSEMFKAYAGENFVAYLRKVRVDAAKKLLETTDSKIYQIGGQVGYPNPKHFNRAFREVTGVSPAEYRNRISNVK
jgi:two-component system response regulator YesN